MPTILDEFEKEQIKKYTSKKSIPAFRTGDTLRITVKIVEGERARLQAFEGLCIARKNNSINSKFTVRKMSHGEGVERVFPLFSPNIEKIEVVRKGNVKRAKLYYLRDRTGKRARIADRDRGEEVDEYALTENTKAVSDVPKEIITVENEEDAPIETAAEDTPKVEEESESSAPEAANTENESKS